MKKKKFDSIGERYNPFAIPEEVPLPDTEMGDNEVHTPTTVPGEYIDVLTDGTVVRMRRESGVPVVVERLGRTKDYVLRALERAAVLTVGEGDSQDESEMTHIEIAVKRLSERARSGDMNAIGEILDRILGKPKQYSENANVSMTLDDVLKQLDGGDTRVQGWDTGGTGHNTPAGRGEYDNEGVAGCYDEEE